MAQRSVMKHQFSQVPRANIPRSRFNRSCGLKTTINSGYLYPIFVDEALPADSHSLSVSLFGRMATPLHPIMDNIRMDLFWFAVPLRLIWSNFQKFMGEQENPGDSTDFLVPTITSPAGGYTELSLEDYFGLPTKVAGITTSALYHRAYNLIFKEWFRDENLVQSPGVNKGDGPDSPGDYKLLKRRKRHDYFTSALPWPQKGPAVELPLGSTAPIIGLGFSGNTGANEKTNLSVRETGGGTTVYPAAYDITQGTENTLTYRAGGAGNNTPEIYADLSTATAATINSIRVAFQVQKWQERQARGGTRYTEVVRSHFGVVSPDARLQRPELLGTASVPVNINPIAQTSETQQTGGNTPQGNLAAMGTVSMSGRGWSKGFTEHCIIMGLVNVRADLTYQQGIEKQFLRSTAFDFYWPSFSHLGEQVVESREIYADGTGDAEQGTGDFSVFGYQERHAEYRYKPSKITGKFRSNADQSLQTWHLSQNFQSRPVLNEVFIQEDPPINRVIAVQSEPEFILDMFFSLTSARPMPTYSVPGLVDHF